MHQEISSNVGGLVGEMQTMREQAAAAENSAREKRADELLRRALGRMKSMSSSRVFTAWRTFLATSKRQKVVKQRVMKRLANVQVNRCFGTWAAAVRAATKEKQQQLFDSQQAAIEEVLARLDPDGTRASIPMHCTATATQHRTLGTTPDYAWTGADHENGVTSRLDHR